MSVAHAKRWILSFVIIVVLSGCTVYEQIDRDGALRDSVMTDDCTLVMSLGGGVLEMDTCDNFSRKEYPLGIEGGSLAPSSGGGGWMASPIRTGPVSDVDLEHLDVAVYRLGEDYRPGRKVVIATDLQDQIGDLLELESGLAVGLHSTWDFEVVRDDSGWLYFYERRESKLIRITVLPSGALQVESTPLAGGAPVVGSLVTGNGTWLLGVRCEPGAEPMDAVGVPYFAQIDDRGRLVREHILFDEPEQAIYDAFLDSDGFPVVLQQHFGGNSGRYDSLGRLDPDSGVFESIPLALEGDVISVRPASTGGYIALVLDEEDNYRLHRLDAAYQSISGWFLAQQTLLSTIYTGGGTAHAYSNHLYQIHELRLPNFPNDEIWIALGTLEYEFEESSLFGSTTRNTGRALSVVYSYDRQSYQDIFDTLVRETRVRVGFWEALSQWLLLEFMV